MTRGDLYLVRKPNQSDPRKQRAFVVVSRQLLINSSFSTVICAPIYSRHDGLSTQVAVGISEGLKHESSVHCDELFSIRKSLLTSFVGRMDQRKLAALDYALGIALDLDQLTKLPS